MTNYFDLSTNTSDEKSHHIWVEKYRPSKLESYIGNETFKIELKRILDTGELTHLMLHGVTPGTGKTTAAKLIVKNINCDYLYINASDENNIDTVRTKIKDFASTSGFSDIKIVILDESDALTPAAQAALKNIIESFSMTTRFIFTCNHVEKIIPPILSRCQVFEIIPPSKKEVGFHLKNILDAEQVKYTIEDLGYIINTYYPDIRKIINFTQQNVTNSQLKVVKNSAVMADLNNSIIELVKKYNGTTTFNDIRQLIADNSVKNFENVYQALFERVEEYAPDKQTMIVLTIAEYLYQSSLVVNKEITFMACIARILKELKS